MTDDLTDRLRLAAKPEEIASVWGLTVVRCSLLRDAADELERLRVAGEDLAEALRDTRRRHQCDCADGYDERTGDLALTEWEKARHD